MADVSSRHGRNASSCGSTWKGVSITYLSRKYQVHPVTIYSWKRMVDLIAEMKDPHASIDELLKELDQLRRDNDRLRIVVSDLVVEKAVQGDIIDAFKKENKTRDSRACGRSHRQRPSRPTCLRPRRNLPPSRLPRSQRAAGEEDLQPAKGRH